MAVLEALANCHVPDRRPTASFSGGPRPKGFMARSPRRCRPGCSATRRRTRRRWRRGGGATTLGGSQERRHVCRHRRRRSGSDLTEPREAQRTAISGQLLSMEATMSPTIRNIRSSVPACCACPVLGLHQLRVSCRGRPHRRRRLPRVNPDVPKSRHGELPPKEAARACLVAAEEMQNSGHVEQAILLYEKARSNDPSLKSVAHHLAVLYDAQGDSARSLAEYNKAVESDPKNPNLLSDLGYYYFERGNLAEAEQWLRKALAIDPNHQKALYQSGAGSRRRKGDSTRVSRLSPKWSVPPRPIPMSASSWRSKDATTRPDRLSTRPSPWTLPCRSPRHSWPTSTGNSLIADKIRHWPWQPARDRRSDRHADDGDAQRPGSQCDRHAELLRGRSLDRERVPVHVVKNLFRLWHLRSETSTEKWTAQPGGPRRP